MSCRLLPISKLFRKPSPTETILKWSSIVVFSKVPQTEWCTDFAAIYNTTRQEAEHTGLGAMDALHVAAADLLNADEFITAEKLDRSIHRTQLLRVRYAYEQEI